jgi:hypothetical protein
MVEKKTLCLLRKLLRIRRFTTLLLITWHTLVAKTRVNHGQTGLLEVGSLEHGVLGHWPLTPARTPRARPPRSPPHGPRRRGSLPPAGPCVVGPPSSNRLPGPIPLLHVFTPAVLATQRRRRRTHAAPPLDGYWLPRHRLAHATAHRAMTLVTPSSRHACL